MLKVNNYKLHFQWSGLTRELPPNVHLMSLEQWEGNSYLARFEHFYQSSEDSELSKPTNISMTVSTNLLRLVPGLRSNLRLMS